MYKRILVPTDGSELSNKAIREAATLSKLVQAELLLLHVRESYDHTSYTEEWFKSSVIYPTGPDNEDEARQEQFVLEPAKGISSMMGVAAVVTYIRSLSPYEGIIEAAQRAKCDLIVMASHGRSGIVGLLLGSETLKVLTHTTIPVLVVR